MQLIQSLIKGYLERVFSPEVLFDSFIALSKSLYLIKTEAEKWFYAVCINDWFSVPRRWEGGDPGVSNQKTPTTILLTPDRKFHSFGYAARDFYHDLDPSESKQWLYLEKFKMKLHTTAVRTQTYSNLHGVN